MGWLSIAHEGQYLEPRMLKANITASGVINSTPNAKYDYSITLSELSQCTPHRSKSY